MNAIANGAVYCYYGRLLLYSVQSLPELNIHVCMPADGVSPFHHAAANGHIEICRLFLERGATLSARIRGASPPLRLVQVKPRSSRMHDQTRDKLYPLFAQMDSRCCTLQRAVAILT